MIMPCMNSTSACDSGGRVALVEDGSVLLGWPGVPGCTTTGLTESFCCARAGKEKRPVEALATNNMQAVSFRISGNSWRVRSGFGLYFFPGLCVPIKHQAARKYTPRSPRERQHRPRVWRIANG